MAGRTLTVFLAADTTKFRQGMATAGASVDGADGLGGKVRGLSDKLNTMLGPALIGAGIAAGTMAVKLGVEGVKAAADEERELAALDKTLRNMGWADQAPGFKSWVDEMARMSTFTDDDLRKPVADLAVAIGGPEGLNTAMSVLPTLMDTAEGSGKKLEAITVAVGKAVNGSTTSLERMFPWLDKNAIASGDLDVITGELATRFKGQASEAMRTYDGRIGEVSQAFDELKESFGAGFLGAMDNAETGAGDLSTQMYELQEPLEEVGKLVGDLVIGFGDLAAFLLDGQKALIEFTDEIGPLGKSLQPFIDPLSEILKILQGIPRAVELAQAAIDGLRGPKPGLLDVVGGVLD